MARQQVLSHNPDLGHEIETHGSPNWTTYGENVGEGLATDPDGLFKAYMNSPEHRENILLSLTAAHRQEYRQLADAIRQLIDRVESA